MLNLIRMDVARMRRMKSLFWVPFLLCAILFLEVFSTKQLYERMNDLSEVASSMDIELDDATEQELKTMNDKLDLKIDVLDSFGELLPSNVFALYLAIFTVLYSFTFLALGGYGFLMFLMCLILGPIIIRIVYEATMMFIMIWRNTRDIAENTKKK